MRGLAPAAAAILCAAAVGSFPPASAVAASPLGWSTPVLVDNQGPFASTTEVRGMSCPNTSLCVGVGPDGKIVTTLVAFDRPERDVDRERTVRAATCGRTDANHRQASARGAGSGARDSVAAVLTAVNANGSSKTTAKIARLILV